MPRQRDTIATEEADVQQFPRMVVAGLLLFAAVRSAHAEAPALASPWVSEPHTRARLISGGGAPDSPAGTMAVGVEIEIADGWKTYWRNPGSSGVPPLLDWSSSSNLASAETRYPAPRRLADATGDTIGYTRRLILPVVITPADPSHDVALALSIEYGVCKDICIPVQKRLELTLPPGAAKKPITDALARTFDRVPRPQNARRPSDPDLNAAKVMLDGDKPVIRLEATFPGGAEGADIFVEAPDGLWIPMAQVEGPPRGDTARFVVDLADGADIADLRGKTIRITLVSPRGATETTLELQ